jgi:hypothetical protein
MAMWGLRRKTVRDRNGWFYMLWANTYSAGHGYRPVAGDDLKVWDENGNVYTGVIQEVHSFLFSSHGEAKLALGGISEHAIAYVQSCPTSGWCVAVRAELRQVGTEPCPVEGQASWKPLSS